MTQDNEYDTNSRQHLARPSMIRQPTFFNTAEVEEEDIENPSLKDRFNDMNGLDVFYLVSTTLIYLIFLLTIFYVPIMSIPINIWRDEGISMMFLAYEYQPQFAEFLANLIFVFTLIPLAVFLIIPWSTRNPRGFVGIMSLLFFLPIIPYIFLYQPAYSIVTGDVIGGLDTSKILELHRYYTDGNCVECLEPAGPFTISLYLPFRFIGTQVALFIFYFHHRYQGWRTPEIEYDGELETEEETRYLYPTNQIDKKDISRDQISK